VQLVRFPITGIFSGTATATHIQGGKVLNISASGSRILATSSPRTSGAGVVTVNPKTLQLTTVKGPNTGKVASNCYHLRWSDDVRKVGFGSLNMTMIKFGVRF